MALISKFLNMFAETPAFLANAEVLQIWEGEQRIHNFYLSVGHHWQQQLLMQRQ